MRTPLILDARQIAILAEMGVRVWQPQAPLGRADLGAKLLNLAPQNTEAPNPKVLHPDAPIPLVVRREPPLRLSVVDAPPRTADFGVTHYVIGNLPAEPTRYDLVVLGVPCEGNAQKLLQSMLQVLMPAKPEEPTTVAARWFVAELIPSQNEAVSLQDQLTLLPAKLVVAMGSHAAQAILGSAAEGIAFSKLRGQLHSPFQAPPDQTTSQKTQPVVVTYHPQQLLRQPKDKAACWQDLRLALRQLSTS
jgi:uracil-DNA glycosylase